MGVKERFESRTNSQSKSYNGVKNRYIAKNIGNIYNDISNRLNAWYQKSSDYYSQSQSRYKNRTGSFNDAYVSDSSDYLASATKQRDELMAEWNDIKSYIKQYSDYIDVGALTDIGSSARSVYKNYDKVVEAAKSDADYWSQWKDESDYGAWATGKKDYYNKYGRLTESSDFEDKSKYVSTYRGGEKYNAFTGTYTNTGYDDIMYDYINRDQKARDIQLVSDIQTDAALLGLDNSERKEMTDDEISIFNYLYATEGKDSAYEYVKYITGDLNARRRETEEAKWVEYAKESPIASSVFSVLTSPLKSVSYVGQAADYFDDGEIDQNAGYNKFSHMNTAIRGEVAKTVEAKWGGVGSFAYQTGMSMGDFLFTTGITGGNSALSLGIMGTSAAADTVVASKDMGLSDNQAFWLGTAAGAIEMATEKIGIDALLDIKALQGGAGKYILKNLLAEGLEEGASNVGNTLVELIDLALSGDESKIKREINLIMQTQNIADEGVAIGKYVVGKLAELGLDALGGAISGGVMGGGGATLNAINNTVQGKQMQKAYGSEIGSALANEALEIDPTNKFAQKMQSRVDSGKNLSNRQIGALVQQNESGMRENDVSAIRSATEKRLTELGETANVEALAEAITKKTLGESLGVRERSLIKNSKFAQRVINELDTENIKSGQYSSAWAERIDTDRINVEEYSRLINEDLGEAENPSKEAPKVSTKQTVEQPTNVEQAGKIDGVSEVKDADTAEVMQADNGETITETEDSAQSDIEGYASTTIEEAAQKDEYKASGATMVQAYSEGQDADAFAGEYNDVFNYAYSGTKSLDRVLKGENFSTLTKDQVKAAYNAGVEASQGKAQDRVSEIKSLANGKTGRRKGVVKGEGVSINDLRTTFNDTQNTAYKVLSRLAEVTGVDIVLYKSETNEKGEFVGAQGKYDGKNAPGTIYIDINAGLKSVKDVGDLANYTMLRTFSHEFSHFIENFNPIWYNELRSAVFEQLSEYGEDVDGLIQTKMEQTGLDYDKASREVVAQALTDVLDDSKFVNNLAENHKNVFNKLLEKLKEFLEDIRTYFASITTNNSREAKAMKKQIGDAMHYVESIIELFDKAAEGAVENYQMTVAVDEVVDKAETKAAEVKETTTEYEHFTITDNAEYGSLEIKFDGKPSEAIRDVLKEHKFRWHKVKGVWYGKGDRTAIADALNKAYAEESTENQSSAEKIDSTDAIKAENNAKKGAVTVKVEEVKADDERETSESADEQQIPFDKRVLSLLQKAQRVGIMKFDGQRYVVPNGVIMLPTTSEGMKYASVELNAVELKAERNAALLKALSEANTLVDKAPIEAKTATQTKTAYVFDIGGKKVLFDKKLFSYIDGGLLYYADFKDGGIIKSVDVDGSVKGYLLSLARSDKVVLTDEKPSKLKSFSKKMQELIDAQNGASNKVDVAQNTNNTTDTETEPPESRPKQVESEANTTSAKSEKKANAPKSRENTVETKKNGATEATKVTKSNEAPKTVETTVRLEDFGEKIGGARKDEWGKRGLLSTDLTEMNDRERDKAVKKDNVWKRPDYRKLIEGGEKREILFARNEIRKSLNQNLTYPRAATPERKLELQKVFVDTVREIQAMAEKATTAEDIKAMGYEWLLKNGYLEITNGYRSGYSYTDKWRKNPALHLSNYVQTIEHLVRNFDKLAKLADQGNFAVDAESKIPAGYTINEDERDHTWYIAKGRYIVHHGLSSYDEALTLLKNAARAVKTKTRFVPRQLQGVHRKGPDYRSSKDVKGQDYLDTFGFKGGEFGNWLSEKDRRVSMNYGFDALKDLADALGVADTDISLNGNLSIAFGARGQGLSGAAAHYERERHVINLTKMNGAGSLAHEWFHALDDFAGGYGNNMATDNLRTLPERTQAAMRTLLSTMQYRDATQEETDMAATKRYEQAKRSVEYQVKTQFGWVEKFENGKLTDADTRYFARKPTEADVKRYHELFDKLLSTGDASVVDELSTLRKEVNGHVISKENRESIGYRLWALKPSETEKVQKMRLRSDYYNNSRLFGELHQKDGDYWDSTVEMAARAFACYVADKTNAQNDYLSAHSDSAVTFTADKSGNPVIVKAFPEGQERIDINRAFDELISAMKEDGILHERGEIVKPDTVQYQSREYLEENNENENGNIHIRGRGHGENDGRSGIGVGSENREYESLSTVQRGGGQSGNRGRLPVSDSEGRRIKPEISEKIKDSKIVDPDGNPLALYHYTPGMDFAKISMSKDVGFHSGTIEQAIGRSKGKNGRIFRSYYNIKSPLNLRTDIGSWKPKMLNLYLWSEGYISESENAEIKALLVGDNTQDYNSPASVRLREILVSHGYDGIVYPNAHEGNGYSYMALFPEQIITTEILKYQNGEVLPGEDVQEQSRSYLNDTDNEGNELSKEQQEFFNDSKARDSKGNLLVLYHGTARAGFTTFDTSLGRYGGSWFTTSRKDADSYAGNYQHKLFDPNEVDDIRSSVGGNFALNSEMRFDSAEDLEKFKKDNPGAEAYLTDAEIEKQLEKAEENDDWDEYDRLENYQYSSERKSVKRAYDRYEWEHSRETDIGELLDNPERFGINDVLRAFDAFDSNNGAWDAVGEGATKNDLVESLRAIDKEYAEDGTIRDVTFKARLPVGESGEIVNRANNRTYAVYANLVRPYEFNANANTLHGASLYPVIENAMNDSSYDGVIVRNAKVGAHEELGDVVIIKEAEQVKLTSNKKPTQSTDIRYQDRNDTLTDREVLELAANELDTSEFTDGERSALDIFNKRLATLRELTEQRAELGRLYREQTFTKGGDRAEASKTRERMKILDGKIEAEGAKLLDVEQKAVLKRVLEKARKVVERNERAHGQELLRRYRERRENALAVKKYRTRIKADVDDLTKWILHPDNKNAMKHVPDALKNTVIPFLTSIDFTSKKQLAGKGATNADELFKERIEALRSAMKKNVDIRGKYSGYNDLPDDFMETLEAFIEATGKLAKSAGDDLVINKMDADQLRSLSKIVKNLKAFVTKVNKFHSNAMFKHVSEAGDSAIEFMQELKPAQHANGVSNFLFWQQIRPAYAFERFGKGGLAIYDELRRGQAKLAFNTKKIVEFAEDTYKAEEVKQWEKAENTITLPSGGSVRMKVSQIMGFYELSKQPDSLRHILEGGIRAATYKGGANERGRKLTEADVEAIVATLTPRQKEVADAMQKFMAEQGAEWGNYVTMARFGEEQFTNPQYYPINSDGRILDVKADEKPGGAELYALLNLSFTKSRIEGANNRIVIYSIFDVFANHMASMAQYNALALPVLDAVKWLNYKQVEIDENGNKTELGRVREEMNVAFGTPEEKGKNAKGYAESFVINVIKAFNGTAAQGTPYDSAGLKALHKYNRAQIAYNMRVVLQQPMAITRAAMLVDYTSIMKGMKLSPKAIKANIEEMREHSGIAAWKALGFYDVNVSRGVTSLIKQEETNLDKVVEFGMRGAEAADTLTWQAIWSACKAEVQRKQKLKPTDEGYFEAVTKLFEDVIYKSQVVDSVLTKNEFMRDKGFFARASGSFMSEPVTNISMLLDAYDKYRMDRQRGMSFSQAFAKNGRMIGRRLYVYAVGAVLLSAVQALADAWRDDDEYEDWHEKYVEALGGNLIDEIMPINKLPYLADVYDLTKELLSAFGVDTYGDTPQSIYMQWADSLISATQILHDKLFDETNYTWYAFIYKNLQTLSGITGLPIATATREAISVWNNVVTPILPSLKVKDYDAGPLASIKYAFKDGYLSEDEATKLLLEQGLVEDENEAYYLIEEWSDEDGKYSKYDNLENALTSGEGFEEAMSDLMAHGMTEKEVRSEVARLIGIMVKEEGMSEDEAFDLLMKYANIKGKTAKEKEENARAKVEYWAFRRDNPKAYEDLTESTYTKYQKELEPYGVELGDFYKAYMYRKEINADEELSSKQKERKIRDYIYQMGISSAHKRKLISYWF